MIRKTKNKIKLILAALIFILIIGIVSAQDNFCCEKRNNESGGGWCIDVTDEANCDLDYKTNPNLCEETTFCKTGCCFDSVEGLCTLSPEQICIDDGGQWDEDENCLIDICQEGCCMWGKNTQFVTETRCEYISLSEGYIDSSISEVDCIFFSEVEGACVLDVGNCIHTTEENCVTNLGGTFNEGVFCSAIPGVDCSAQNHTGCAEEENLYDVYNFDSCENREDVNTSCNYPSGKCVDGVCKDISCIDEEGNTREHLESWCVYDGYVGDSRDVVGSTHWKRWCEDGEVKFEQCNNYRNEICAEKVIEEISIAQCRVNLGLGCYSIDNTDECEDMPDCRIESVYVTDHFYFDACVAKFPPGFDIDSTDTLENGEDICSIGTQTCTTVERKPFGGSWECKTNCKCKEYDFVKQMNDFCISLGDCGGYINIEGDYVKNFQSSDRGYRGDLKEDDINEYKTYLTKENEEENLPQYISSLDSVNYLGIAMIKSVIKEKGYDEDIIEEIVSGLGLSKGRTRSLTFTCQPWKPRVGGDNCDKCNEDLLKPCNEYRCSSLGTACGLINTDYEYPICIDKYPDDSAPPVISPGEVLTEGYDFTSTDFVDKKVEIKTETAEECIQEFTLINFSLNTDEYAWCKFNYERTNWNDYETTGEYSNEGNELTKNHTFEIRIPYLDSPYVDSGDFNIYIRCQDPAGNLNIDEYIVNFCITEGPDFEPPTIIRTYPESESFLGYGVEESVLEIYLDEPTDCKYDVVENTAYDDMSYNFTCELYNASDTPKLEYSCLTEIISLTETENKIYIKCKDHPEFEDDGDETNDDDRNINPQDYLYILYATENELKIDSISPENGSVIEKSTIDRKIELEVTTSGGMNNDGVSECKYKFEEQGWSDWFTETNAASHKYTFTSLPGGDYKINVTCKDAAENLATNITEFTLNIDTTSPVITYIIEDGNIILTTDEDAECAYDLGSCIFDIDDKEYPEDITTAFSTEHTIYNLNPKLTYYVKCADVWGNTNCTTIEATETNDGMPPIVVRTYYKEGKLKLITNEKAKCYYDFDDCDFGLENGTSMTTAFSTEHSADWNLGWTYHIKCKDDWDPPNENSDCAIIVEPSSL